MAPEDLLEQTIRNLLKTQEHLIKTLEIDQRRLEELERTVRVLTERA